MSLCSSSEDELKESRQDSNEPSRQVVEQETSIVEEPQPTQTTTRTTQFERKRALSVIKDTDDASTKVTFDKNIEYREPPPPPLGPLPQTIRKRTKAFQRSFEQQTEADRIATPVPINEINDLPTTTVESESSEMNEVDDFDPRFVYQFAPDFLRPKIKPIKQIEILREQTVEDFVLPEPSPVELESPQELEQPVRSRIDLNFFNFFKRKFRFPRENENENEELDDEFVEPGDDWLLKWCIFSEMRQKECERVFRDYDWSGKGCLAGRQLLLAIEALCKLDNLKLNYLFSLLKLCDAEPLTRGAGPELFTVICALANRIQHLDDDWFHNMLPALDLSTVENKMFKVSEVKSLKLDFYE